MTFNESDWGNRGENQFTPELSPLPESPEGKFIEKTMAWLGDNEVFLKQLTPENAVDRLIPGAQSGIEAAFDIANLERVLKDNSSEEAALKTVIESIKDDFLKSMAGRPDMSRGLKAHLEALKDLRDMPNETDLDQLRVTFRSRVPKPRMI